MARTEIDPERLKEKEKKMCMGLLEHKYRDRKEVAFPGVIGAVLDEVRENRVKKKSERPQ